LSILSRFAITIRRKLLCYYTAANSQIWMREKAWFV